MEFMYNLNIFEPYFLYFFSAPEHDEPSSSGCHPLGLLDTCQSASHSDTPGPQRLVKWVLQCGYMVDIYIYIFIYVYIYINIMCIYIYIVNMWWIHGGYTMFLSVSIMQNWMWVNDRDTCGAEGMKYLKASNCFVADRSTILCKNIDNSWNLKTMTSGRCRKGVLLANKCMELQCTCLRG